uniref:Uncharacterized protein ycf33 n=1 Tax=Kalanchoe fedtschenkoi TaxID=63787 RepID=A0A7N0RCR2_KALFE
MKILMLRSPLTHIHHHFPLLNPARACHPLLNHHPPCLNKVPSSTSTKLSCAGGKRSPVLETESCLKPQSHSGSDGSRCVVLGAVSVGVLLVLMGMDEHKALALGPQGPLMEEFWDNVRRYALYILTVSTGALYTIFEPIYELLKNPISAILVLVIIGGGFFIVSQVLNAMIGASDFSYQYYY